MHSTCPHEREAQQGGIDLLGLLEGLEVDREIDQCIVSVRMERMLRALGRSIPRSLAWLLMRSQDVR